MIDKLKKVTDGTKPFDDIVRAIKDSAKVDIEATYDCVGKLVIEWGKRAADRVQATIEAQDANAEPCARCDELREAYLNCLAEDIFADRMHDFLISELASLAKQMKEKQKKARKEL